MLGLPALGFTEDLRHHLEGKVVTRSVLIVGRVLAKLPDAWLVLHDLPLGSNGANLDHLVVGSPGVFSLNTKNLTGKVWVAERALLHNGHKTDFLPKARREAERVSRSLGAAGVPVAVHPVLVLMCDDYRMKAQPLDVAVVRRRELRRWLERQPIRLSPQEVEAVRAVAVRAETWSC